MCDSGDRFCASCGATLSIDGSSTNADPLIGRTIGGSYTIQDIIGVGGMGRVYRAEQGALGRTVAIKVIHPHLLGDEQTVARFYQEARTASRMNHPNSVGIIDFGRTDDGILYLAMEFLQGKDLAMVMHEEGPIAASRSCDILISTLDALSEGHAIGVVHRDIKPENIIIKKLRTGADLVKVVDFGLATIVEGATTSITRPGLVCGTPDYMAPEQARGDQVDGRSDLYSLGVVLFELLSGRLPFEDDTPTRVVLRHINDPVPDPRQIAPERSIPDTLAAVTMKALAKSPGERFQNASEMQEALRSAVRVSYRAPKESILCPSCRTENAPTMKFCGNCGGKLPSSEKPMRPTAITQNRPSFAPVSVFDRPFVGRAAELERIDALHEEARAGGFRWVGLRGESGSGRTRLLTEVSDRFREAGDIVVGAGAHPSGAPVAYAGIRQIIDDLRALLGPERLAAVESSDRLASPLVQAGFDEVKAPVGTKGRPGQSRSGAVAMALAAAAENARVMTGAGAVVIVVDDLDRCDALTREVVKRLGVCVGSAPLLLLTAHATLREELPGAELLSLAGFEEEAAGALMSSTPTTLPPMVGANRLLLPLYIEQIDVISRHGEDQIPARIADALGLRVERLSLPARRALQAAAVLGDRCLTSDLKAIGGLEDVVALHELAHEGLIHVEDDLVEIAHPFLREIVEAFIPAAARRELHQRALAVRSASGAEIEVRAEHAYRAGEPMSALIVLERMGDQCTQRGDPSGAVLAYRRALEIARRELLESGDLMMESALVSFSRKLGEALTAAGDLAGADGVLREALDLAPPRSRERSVFRLALARVAFARGRHRDAMRLLGQVLEAVADGDDEALESEAQLCLGMIRVADSAPGPAANSFRRALEILERRDTQPDEVARAYLDLARALVQVGDFGGATDALERAKVAAERADAPALLAEVAGLVGMLNERSGEIAAARGHYRDAARLSQTAGCLEAYRSWAEASGE